ncbi:MAG TPA: glycosyltransferase [Bryobacteraceae bacterium]|nr:glycosyltransferase [Bryobacteraceae bacterium]
MESVSSRAINAERLRILLLSIVNPQVERNGAATVTRGLLRLLTSPAIGAETGCIPVRAAPCKWHRLAQAGSLLKSSVSTLPSKASFLHSRQFLDEVKLRIRNEHWDAIILNGADLLWVSEHLPGSIPRILVAHNIEHLLFDSQIQNLSWAYRPLRGLLRSDLRRLRDFELQGIRDTRNIIFLSSEDAAYATLHCPDIRSAVIPPVFPEGPVCLSRQKPGPVLRLGYVGNFGWWPNQLGLRWFAKEVLPHVSVPFQLNLFGYGSEFAWRGDRRVVGHGMVEDMERILSHCDLLICPAFAGGGVSVKLVEAVYNRMPVLANKNAGRGLPLVDDPAVVFLDDGKDWAALLNSSAARETAQRTVAAETAERFAVHSYVDVLGEFLRGVVSWAPRRSVDRMETSQVYLRRSAATS